MLFFQFIESNYLLSLSMRDMFMVKIIFLFLFFISGGYHVFSKTDSAGATKEIFIRKTKVAVKLDGVLDDEAWKHAERGGDFHQYFPYDTSYSKSKTQGMFAYDEHFIYFAAIMYDSLPGKHVSLSLRRDFRGGNADGITVVFDPFLDKTNGFFFGVNPYGVQREGLVSNGGFSPEDFNLSWDNKWYSAAKVYPNCWIAEMAIPLKTLRYKEGSKEWHVNFYRIDSKYNERALWVKMPRQFEMFNLAHTGILHFEEPLHAPGMNISLIPYINGNYTLDKESDPVLSKLGYDIGGDAKVSITPSLNLDLTVLPDFSQVEVDQQQTNISRFELFFPERRQFFLENADLFSNFGFGNARPFFSRRIGITIDSSTAQNVQNKIWAGGRLSGKIGNDWRVGAMSMQTAADNSINTPSYNYSVLAVQRKLFSRSNIGAIVVNKQNFEGKPIDIENPEEGSSNTLAGIDYNLASKDGKWTGKSYMHSTFNKNTSSSKPELSHGLWFGYTSLNYFWGWEHQLVTDNFNPKVGYVPRNNFLRAQPYFGKNFYPKSKHINNITALFFSETFANNQTLFEKNRVDINDFAIGTEWEFSLQNTSAFGFFGNRNYVKLFDDFSPSGNDDELLKKDEEFWQYDVGVFYASNPRKPFNFRVSGGTAAYYVAQLYWTRFNIEYRYQQYATIAINANFNSINFDSHNQKNPNRKFTNTNLVLIGPRIDITFTKNIFWTTFIQYNNQAENVNINSRIQWRFQPVSDIYLVYTDNYSDITYGLKNRAIVFKITYWLNL